MTFDGDNSKKLLEEVKYDIEILSEEWKMMLLIATSSAYIMILKNYIS